MAKKPIIELKDVWKIYQMGEVTVNALRGLTLQVYKGEFVAISGPSGSGKSTAMNMVGCLDVPSKGIIKLDGQNISELGESKLAQIRGRKIGFVFQQFNLIQSLTALENVMLPMLFQNKSAHEREKKAMELLQLVDLEDRANHKPSELSGGQQQRVAIARSLANSPEMILADEPTGNLDTKTGELIMAFLKKLNKDGTTVVMVTHDSDKAKAAQRIIHIRDGVCSKS
ncbi:MAG: ABC transporter ATP-binding protein [Nanoarchaeota archaeon]|nr:ABC transporter ATP-binding protein [Nanoarchaeota archaeon]